MADTQETQETIEQMFSAGAHFGYSRSRRHPSTAEYIFGVKNKVEIFDLEKTSTLLENAKHFMRTLGSARKNVLYVGGKNEARQTIEREAETIGMPYVASRWIGGTLTNFPQIRGRVDRLEELTSMKEKGELGMYTKREQLEIDRDIEELDATFGGLRAMKKLPDAILIVDTRSEHIAVAEARKVGIPIVGVMNSDCDAALVTYPVVGNDSTVTSIAYFVHALTTSYQAGQDEAPPVAAEGKKEENTEKK